MKKTLDKIKTIIDTEENGFNDIENEPDKYLRLQRESSKELKIMWKSKYGGWGWGEAILFLRGKLELCEQKCG